MRRIIPLLIILAAFVPLASAAARPPLQKAIFAGGCFWCTQHDFEEIPGVVGVTAGYIGGHVLNPTYEQVSAHGTGHAEAIEVLFDPGKISYRQLVNRFWRLVDPTTEDRQFCDVGGVGGPYRSEIFYRNDDQKRDAEASKAQIEKSKSFPEPIVTKITKASTFYRAEEYHQDYWKKDPIRYRTYRSGCGRDARLAQLWAKAR